MRRCASPARVAERHGFTIVELMIVVTIIGLLAVLAIPAVFRARLRAQNTAFANDMRILTAAMERYAIQEGDYPPDAEPGVPPVKSEPYMPRHYDWTEVAPIGGHWDWDRAADRQTNVFGLCYAGLSVVHPRRTTAQMVEIDRHIDNGDLDTGRFRRRDDGYIYILE